MGHPEIREKCPNDGSFINLVKKTRMKLGIIKKYIFLSSELSLLFFFLSKFCLWSAGKTYTKPGRSPWASGKTERTNFRHFEFYRYECISYESETTFAGQYGFLFFCDWAGLDLLSTPTLNGPNINMTDIFRWVLWPMKIIKLTGCENGLRLVISVVLFRNQRRILNNFKKDFLFYFPVPSLRFPLLWIEQKLAKILLSFLLD